MQEGLAGLGLQVAELIRKNKLNGIEEVAFSRAISADYRITKTHGLLSKACESSAYIYYK